MCIRDSSYSGRVSTAQRRKRVLADRLPSEPGVYVFRDQDGRPLYVGTSGDIRARARSYFTASEKRSRMAQMVGLAASIQPIVCQTTLEAQIRELRLIAAHKPRYNRRSTRPCLLYTSGPAGSKARSSGRPNGGPTSRTCLLYTSRCV